MFTNEKVFIYLFIINVSNVFSQEDHLFQDTSLNKKKKSISIQYDCSFVFTEGNGYNSKKSTLFFPPSSISMYISSMRAKNKIVIGLNFQQQYFQSRNPGNNTFNYNSMTYNYTLNKKWKANFVCGEIRFDLILSKSKLQYITPHFFFGVPILSHVEYDYAPDYNISPYIDNSYKMNDFFVAGGGVSYRSLLKSYKKIDLSWVICLRYRYINIEDELNLGVGVELKIK